MLHIATRPSHLVALLITETLVYISFQHMSPVLSYIICVCSTSSLFYIFQRDTVKVALTSTVFTFQFKITKYNIDIQGFIV
jgi:hypothetical protein